MPSDITGTEVIEEDKTTGGRQLRFVHGPIFANVILADEINRTPPKTQAALLEAMQEHQVTVGGQAASPAGAVLRAGDAEPDRAGRHVSAARSAARPVHVQHQRRLPEEEEEFQIVRLTTMGRQINLEQVLSGDEVHRSCRRSCARCRWRITSSATRCSSARLTRQAGGRGAGLRERLRALGRRPAGEPVPDPRRQGPGAAQGPLSRQHRRHPRGRAARCCGTAS